MGIIMKQGIEYTGSDKTLETALIYSTEEREVGVWTDGKPLYKKTWLFDNYISINSNSRASLTSQGVSIPNLDVLVDAECPIRIDKRAWFPVAIGMYSTDLSLFNYSNAKIEIDCITIYYTKTTDVAGSGIWTTTGEYAHHYSTDEKVVGTWIDGKPLYERTITGNISGTAYTTITPAGWTDISEIVKMFGVCMASNGTANAIGTYRPNTDWYSWFMASPTDVAHQVGPAFTGGKYTVTLQYTKTTD